MAKEKTKLFSVRLRETLAKEIEEIAQNSALTRNQILVCAIASFCKMHRENRLDISEILLRYNSSASQNISTNSEKSSAIHEAENSKNVENREKEKEKEKSSNDEHTTGESNPNKGKNVMYGESKKKVSL